MRHPAEEPISIREAARRIGLNKSTLARQVRDGMVRAHDGKVFFSEVLEDRAANVDLMRSSRRLGVADAAERPAPEGGASEADAPDAEAQLETVMVDGRPLPFPVAKALKETYLARLRKLEFDVKTGSLVDRQAAERLFFEVGRDLRDAWMAWPARIAVEMAEDLKVDPRILSATLSTYVVQHLSELGEPEAQF